MATQDQDTTAASSLGGVKILGIITLIGGIILTLAGGVAWFTVKSRLAAENIVVAEGADNFVGEPVDGPLTAFAQANVIKKHELKATGGKNYAELEQDDPVRVTAMTASFLRASIFTSVLAFGVSAMAAGLGLLFILVGVALLQVAKPRE